MDSFTIPKAVLFDLFHTLAFVPSPEAIGDIPVSQILGLPGSDWHRLYYDEDILGRGIGRICDGVEAMRRITHALDATVDEPRILAATESRRRRFEIGLVEIDRPILNALDRLRTAGVRTALVSDAGADDVEAWDRSPLCERLDATVFSFQVGIRKPDPRIYEHALKTIGIHAEDAFFVGDGGSDEHRGARELGMRTVMVTRSVELFWPEQFQKRRAHADWEFVDVPAFVDALGL